jgi:tetratricopeptide (TPR) repeat protein
MHSVIPLRGLSLLAFLCLSFNLSVSAQSRTNTTGTGGLNEIRGRIFLPDGRSPDTPIKVELQSYDSGTLSVESDRNGSYSFQGLSAGNYRIVVNAGDPFEPAEDRVTIDNEVQTTIRVVPIPKIVNVPIHLVLKRAISQKARILNAKLAALPKPAVELYEKSQDSLAKGNATQALAELRQAIAAYNAFSQAWSDLGVILEKNGDQKGAIDAFRNAVRFDNDSKAAILNLGCALAEAKEYTQAEKYLAVALTKDGSLYRGHFYLGVVEAKLGHYPIAEQAFLKAIELGGNKAAQAHYMLAGVYWATQNYRLAADQLELYLKLDPSAKDAGRTRESISELRRKQGGVSTAPRQFS